MENEWDVVRNDRGWPAGGDRHGHPADHASVRLGGGGAGADHRADRRQPDALQFAQDGRLSASTTSRPAASARRGNVYTIRRSVLQSSPGCGLRHPEQRQAQRRLLNVDRRKRRFSSAVNAAPLIFLNGLARIDWCRLPTDAAMRTIISRFLARPARRDRHRIRPDRRRAFAGHRCRRRHRRQRAGEPVDRHLQHELRRTALTVGVRVAYFSTFASDTSALPGLSGFCCEACGAQPDIQTIANVALTRPSGSAKRSA